VFQNHDSLSVCVFARTREREKVGGGDIVTEQDPLVGNRLAIPNMLKLGKKNIRRQFPQMEQTSLPLHNERNTPVLPCV
jgi:hypothetical protein